MYQWLGILLVGVVVFIVWDLSRYFIKANKKDVETVIIEEPGKEQVRRYAQAFQSLATTFSSMPYRKERLNSSDIEEIFDGVSQRVCGGCVNQELCWKKNYFETYKAVYDILGVIEESGATVSEHIRRSFSQICIHPIEFLNEMVQVFGRAKLNMMWSNKLMEQRAVVAEQLGEVAQIMTVAAGSMYDVTNIQPSLEEEIKGRLSLLGLQVRKVRVLADKDKRQELYITMRAGKGGCVPAKEIATELVTIFDKRMSPSVDGRRMVNQEYSTLRFVEDTYFQMLTGVAKVTKDGETISGDNFAFIRKEDGQMVMSLSDGMGSGLRACKESEMVIELLEQFLEAGFAKETAVKMINSVMILHSQERSFSTIDICTVDLYSGVCEFLKIGAATTFIKRGTWVEAITSTSLPAGMFSQVDYDITSKKLYDGDFLIMVSDGVLDALPQEHGEEMLKEMMMMIQSTNAKEFAKTLLEQVLISHQCKVTDDMTVLVGGLWKK